MFREIRTFPMILQADDVPRRVFEWSCGLNGALEARYERMQSVEEPHIVVRSHLGQDHRAGIIDTVAYPMDPDSNVLLAQLTVDCQAVVRLEEGASSRCLLARSWAHAVDKLHAIGDFYEEAEHLTKHYDTPESTTERFLGMGEDECAFGVWVRLVPVDCAPEVLVPGTDIVLRPSCGFTGEQAKNLYFLSMQPHFYYRQEADDE